MRHDLRFLLFWALTSAASADTARAQDSEHQIPYQGHLDFGGAPLTGQYDFWFELYPTPTGGDCLAGPPVDCLWADEITDVSVAGGAFSVILGSAANPLGDVIWQNVEVYLGIRVAPRAGAYTPLAGRQRILAVPLAARADTAQNFHVTGTLRVDGGAAILGGLGVQDGLQTDAILLGYQGWNSHGTGDGGAGIYNDAGTYRSLMITGNTSAGGTRQVSIWDDLHVNDNIYADNLWMKVAEQDLSASAGTTITDLDGNQQKVYKVIFQGSVNAGGSDKRIYIRPNGVSSVYNGWSSYSGSAGGFDFDTSAFYVGRSGYGQNADVSFEYTIAAMTGVRRTGFGSAMFVMANLSLLGFQAFGYWQDSSTNITSLWVGPSSGGTLTGKLMVFATR